MQWRLQCCSTWAPILKKRREGDTLGEEESTQEAVSLCTVSLKR